MKLSESLSFDVYNMHAKAGKWVFRAPECSLKRGVCVYTHAEKFLLDTHCHHVHKPIGALICTAPEERAVPGWVHH